MSIHKRKSYLVKWQTYWRFDTRLRGQSSKRLRHLCREYAQHRKECGKRRIKNRIVEDIDSTFRLKEA